VNAGILEIIFLPQNKKKFDPWGLTRVLIIGRRIEISQKIVSFSPLEDLTTGEQYKRIFGHGRLTLCIEEVESSVPKRPWNTQPRRKKGIRSFEKGH